MTTPPGKGSSARGPRRLAHSLEQLLGNLDAPPVDAVTKIFQGWAKIVGPDLAEHTRPTVIDGSTLVVSASDPVWANEFRWLEKEVLERLREELGNDRIQAVNVRVQRRE